MDINISVTCESDEGSMQGRGLGGAANLVVVTFNILV